MAYARSIRWKPFCDVSRGTDGAHCGLIADEVFARTYLREFAHRECAELPEPVIANCAVRVHHHFLFRVGQRYARLERGALRGICEKIPLRCSNPLVLELVALEAHNYSLDHFPNADFAVNNAEAVGRMRARVHAVVDGVVPWVLQRIGECEDGSRDCSCPEGIFTDRRCELPSEPQAPAGDDETEWL
jgi:hypothetical protein